MSSDVVVFQTERIVPRLGAPRRPMSTAAPAVRAANEATQPLTSIEEIDRRPGWSDRLAERVAAAGARLGQLTFYLLDPESWR
jgi:hypothetical protein